MKKGSI